MGVVIGRKKIVDEVWGTHEVCVLLGVRISHVTCE